MPDIGSIFQREVLELAIDGMEVSGMKRPKGLVAANWRLKLTYAEPQMGD